MLQKGFFLTVSSNPILPLEEWELVEDNNTPGAYSYNYTWGKYKIVISGGGGSGGAVIREANSGAEYKINQNGYAGEEKTIYIDVPYGETKTVSGTVGSGAGGASVYINSGSGAPLSSSYGSVGTGYASGNTANTKYAVQRSNLQGWGSVGGSGGGSTSLLVDGDLNSVAAGGNGGTTMLNDGGNRYSNGGAGGSGGTTSGTGAAGGASVYWIGYSNHAAHTAVSGSGANGYIRIYKSNLKPEPL